LRRPNQAGSCCSRPELIVDSGHGTEDRAGSFSLSLPLIAGGPLVRDARPAMIGTSGMPLALFKTTAADMDRRRTYRIPPRAWPLHPELPSSRLAGCVRCHCYATLIGIPVRPRVSVDPAGIETAQQRDSWTETPTRGRCLGSTWVGSATVDKVEPTLSCPSDETCSARRRPFEFRYDTAISWEGHVRLLRIVLHVAVNVSRLCVT